MMKSDKSPSGSLSVNAEIEQKSLSSLSLFFSIIIIIIIVRHWRNKHVVKSAIFLHPESPILSQVFVQIFKFSPIFAQVHVMMGGCLIYGRAEMCRLRNVSQILHRNVQVMKIL